MLRQLGLRNFKSFGSNMEKARLERITLIYGPNSSGKSSIIQALLLLKQSLGLEVSSGKQEPAKSQDTWGKRELIPNGDYVDLGSIPAIFHMHETRSTIDFEITFDCPYPRNAKYIVTLTYEAERSEPTSNVRDNSVLTGVNYKINLASNEIFSSEASYKYGDESVAWDVGVTVKAGHLMAEEVCRISPRDDRAHYLPELGLSRPRGSGLFNRLHPLRRTPELQELNRKLRIEEAKQVTLRTIERIDQQISTRLHEFHARERELKGVKDSVIQYLMGNQEVSPLEARRVQRSLWIAEGQMEKSQQRLDELYRAQASHKMHLEELDQQYSELSLPDPRHEKAVEDFATATQRQIGGTSTRALGEWAENRYWNRMEPDELLALIPENIPRAFEDHLSAITHIGPVRDSPERAYRILNAGKDTAGIKGEYSPQIIFGNPEVKREVNYWLSKFEIPYELDVRRDAGDILITGERLVVELVDKRTGTPVSLADVGFGISCVLPIIVEGVASPENSIICVEQPELHLHPRLQAHLANFMVATSKDEIGKRKQWLVETHSELLQLRLSALIAAKEEDYKIDAADVSILFVSPPNDHDRYKGSSIKDLKALDDGELDEEWPSGFFDEATEELMKIIRSQEG